MKKSLHIFALVAALVVGQACGPKSEKIVEEPVTVEVPKTSVVLTATEKRAKLEKDIAAWEEKKRIALIELAKITPTYTDAKGIVVYNRAEVEPVFDGGREAMRKYLNDNLVYPKDAQDKGLEGTVFVDFIVGTNGIVREVVVTEETSAEIDPSFRNEAVRVVTAMPKWLPGRQHGEAVDVKYSLPITFQIF